MPQLVWIHSVVAIHFVRQVLGHLALGEVLHFVLLALQIRVWVAGHFLESIEVHLVGLQLVLLAIVDGAQGVLRITQVVLVVGQLLIHLLFLHQIVHGSSTDGPYRDATLTHL